MLFAITIFISSPVWKKMTKKDTDLQKYTSLYVIHKICPRLLKELLSASSFRLQQREFSLVPELVCWCAANVWSVDCEQSWDLPSWPWLPASRCFLGSCGCGLAVWQAGLCPLPANDNPPHPQCPALIDTRPHTHPSWPYHDFSRSAAHSPGMQLSVWKENDCINAMVSDRGARHEPWPACCHGDVTVI